MKERQSYKTLRHGIPAGNIRRTKTTPQHWARNQFPRHLFPLVSFLCVGVGGCIRRRHFVTPLSHSPIQFPHLRNLIDLKPASHSQTQETANLSLAFAPAPHHRQPICIHYTLCGFLRGRGENSVYFVYTNRISSSSLWRRQATKTNTSCSHCMEEGYPERLEDYIWGIEDVSPFRVRRDRKQYSSDAN